MDKLSKKKSLTILIIFGFMFMPALAYNGFSDTFIEKFKTCSIYAENNSLNNKGTIFNDTKFFTKETNNQCHYHQMIWSTYGTIDVQCKFTPEQVTELYNTMKEHNPSSSYSKEAETLWNSFVNDKNICKIKTTSYMDGQALVPDEYLPWKVEKPISEPAKENTSAKDEAVKTPKETP